MDQIIEKARKRLQALETEAEQIRAFIHMYERLAGEEIAPDSPTRAPPTESLRTPATRNFGKASPTEIVVAAKELMTEKQRPLTRSELVRLLTLRGLRIAGGDKAKNVGTIIWRSKEFENVEGKGYWPLDKGPWSNSEFNF